MRKILLSLLLATTVATPALAQRHDRHDSSDSREESRSNRSEQSREQARPERSERQADRAEVRANRAEARANIRAEREVRVDNSARMNAAGGEAAVRERMGFSGQGSANVNERGRPTLDERNRSNANISAWQQRQREQVTEQVRDRRRAARQRVERVDSHDVAQQRIEQQAERRARRAPAGARPDRMAPVPQTASRDNRHHRWNPDWRRDHRYDWRSHRRHHRSIFHIGFYSDPFGWGYQRYNVGWRLWPNYYGSNYWLNDPSMYALPYAPFPYKWVRYYNDALLVNTYTGQVADVIYDFFW